MKKLLVTLVCSASLMAGVAMGQTLDSKAPGALRVQRDLKIVIVAAPTSRLETNRFGMSRRIAISTLPVDKNSNLPQAQFPQARPSPSAAFNVPELGKRTIVDLRDVRYGPKGVDLLLDALPGCTTLPGRVKLGADQVDAGHAAIEIRGCKITKLRS